MCNPISQKMLVGRYYFGQWLHADGTKKSTQINVDLSSIKSNVIHLSPVSYEMIIISIFKNTKMTYISEEFVVSMQVSRA